MPALSAARRASPGFIEPCLPSSADKPPSGLNWIYEIKHDGLRLMARRDPVGIRLITRQGLDDPIPRLSWRPRTSSAGNGSADCLNLVAKFR